MLSAHRIPDRYYTVVSSRKVRLASLAKLARRANLASLPQPKLQIWMSSLTENQSYLISIQPVEMSASYAQGLKYLGRSGLTLVLLWTWHLIPVMVLRLTLAAPLVPNRSLLRVRKD